MKYVSVEEMIKIERQADASGHTYPMMMEHAGRGLAEVVRDTYDHLKVKRALGLVGPGNNGGDTLVAFAYLQEWGWQTTAYLVRPRPDDPLVQRAQETGGEVIELETDTGYQQLQAALADHTVMLDGVLGTGIKLPLRGEIAKVLDFAREALQGMDVPPHVVAVDCPSGVDCDSGAAAPECIPADVTVTMAAIKKGLLHFPAYGLLGELRLVEIGLPDGLDAYQAVKRVVVDGKMVRASLPDRPLDAHKGTFGTALVVAGSVNYTGAVVLAGEAAYRAGAGLVTLAVPTPLHAALAGQFPEATWLLLPHEVGVIAAQGVKIIQKSLDKATAILVGPGFGVEDTSKEFIARLIGSGPPKGPAGLGFVQAKGREGSDDQAPFPPMVVDADGLKLLAQIPDWHDLLPAPAVLTPHPGEMSVLSGLSVKEIQADRLMIAEKFAKEWGHVVVLKGAHTVVAAPDGRTAIVPVASPALARAGTGDVLAGLIVGLMAQGVEAFPAAAVGAWIHAQAGLYAANVLGSTASVLAGDVLAAVVDVMASVA